MTNAKSLLNITFLSTLSRMVFFLFVFLTSFITSRALTKAEFGELQYLMLIVNIGWILFNFGIPNLLSRYFTQAVSQKSFPVVKRLLRMTLIAGVVTFCLTNLLLKIVHPHTEVEIPFWVLFGLIFLTLALFYLQILVQALFAYAYVLVVNILACGTALVFLVNMLPNLGGITFLYTYMIVNGMLAIGYLLVLINGLRSLQHNQEESPYKLPDQRSILKSAVYFGGSAILAGLLWQRYELSLLKYSVPFAELANYMIAFSVMALVIEPLKLIPSALIYYFASLSNDHAKASEKFETFYKHFSWLVFFAGAFVFFHADNIVHIIYTDKYSESAAFLKILLVGMIPGTTSYVMMNMHVGLGRSKFLVTQDILGVLLFGCLLYVGNHYYGLAGAAWAKSITVMVSVGLGLWYTAKQLKYTIPYYSLLGTVALSIGLCALTQFYVADSLFILISKAILLFIVYIGISWWTHIIDKEMVTSTLGRMNQSFKRIFQR
jgi:O-antigen/teichoic acid export membrane protein